MVEVPRLLHVIIGGGIKISNSETSTSNYVGAYSVGGIVGYIQNNIQIKGCYSNEPISKEKYSSNYISNGQSTYGVYNIGTVSGVTSTTNVELNTPEAITVMNNAAEDEYYKKGGSLPVFK